MSPPSNEPYEYQCQMIDTVRRASILNLSAMGVSLVVLCVGAVIYELATLWIGAALVGIVLACNVIYEPIGGSLEANQLTMYLRATRMTIPLADVASAESCSGELVTSGMRIFGIGPSLGYLGWYRHAGATFLALVKDPDKLVFIKRVDARPITLSCERPDELARHITSRLRAAEPT